MTADGWQRASDDTDTLALAADRLRLVRRAHERFLALHAIDHLLAAAAGPLVDAVDDDLRGTPDNHGSTAAARRPSFHGGQLDD